MNTEASPLYEQAMSLTGIINDSHDKKRKILLDNLASLPLEMQGVVVSQDAFLSGVLKRFETDVADYLEITEKTYDRVIAWKEAFNK